MEKYYIDLGKMRFYIPHGYKQLLWALAEPGREVYLIGTIDNGKPYAYGPHTVVDPKIKQLVNSKGVQFYAPMEELLIKEK